MSFWSIRPRVVALALLCVAVIYSGLWFWEAAKARTLVTRYVTGLQRDHYGITLGDMSVGGYPFAIRVSLPNVAIAGFPRLNDAQLTAQLLEAKSWPWDPTDWAVSAPQGLDFALTSGEQKILVQAKQINADISVAQDGGYRLKVQAINPVVNRGVQTQKSAAISLELRMPAKQADDPDSPSLDFKLNLDQLTLSAPIEPLGATIDTIGVAGSVNGPVPQMPLAAALAAWRDGGGTIEVRQLGVNWGKLSLDGTGTVALDKDMQPQAAFSMTLRGWAAGLDGLAAAGAIRPEQANFLRLGLLLFAHPGADGESELKAPLTIQNGELFVEKARIGRVPRLVLPAS